MYIINVSNTLDIRLRRAGVVSSSANIIWWSSSSSASLFCSLFSFSFLRFSSSLIPIFPVFPVFPFFPFCSLLVVDSISETPPNNQDDAPTAGSTDKTKSLTTFCNRLKLFLFDMIVRDKCTCKSWTTVSVNTSRAFLTSSFLHCFFIPLRMDARYLKWCGINSSWTVARTTIALLFVSSSCVSSVSSVFSVSSVSSVSFLASLLQLLLFFVEHNIITPARLIDWTSNFLFFVWSFPALFVNFSWTESFISKSYIGAKHSSHNKVQRLNMISFSFTSRTCSSFLFCFDNFRMQVINTSWHPFSIA